MGMLGGMIGPMVDEDTVTAAANSFRYPWSVMALISTMPSPPASATADPDIPAKIMLARTLAWARPPRMGPTSARAKSKRRSVIPPSFIRRPVSMKNGIEISTKESTPVTMRCAIPTNGKGEKKQTAMKTATPSPTATGTLATARTTKLTTMAVIIAPSLRHPATAGPPDPRPRTPPRGSA